MMKRVRYIGSNLRLHGQEGYMKFDDQDRAMVQLDGYPTVVRTRRGKFMNIPTIMIRGVDWAYGWHITPKEDWEVI